MRLAMIGLTAALLLGATATAADAPTPAARELAQQLYRCGYNLWEPEAPPLPVLMLRRYPEGC